MRALCTLLFCAERNHRPDVPSGRDDIAHAAHPLKMRTGLLPLTRPSTFSPPLEPYPCALSPKDDLVYRRLKKRHIDSE